MHFNLKRFNDLFCWLLPITFAYSYVLTNKPNFEVTTIKINITQSHNCDLLEQYLKVKKKRAF